MITPLRVLYCFLALAILWLQIHIWLGRDSLFGIVKLHHQLAQAQQQKQVLQKRNDQLLIQTQALKGDNQAIEAYARYNLGLIKQGEVYYQIYRGVPQNAHSDHE